MKRMTVFALVLVLVLALCACGSSKSQDATVAATVPTTAAAATETRASVPVTLALSDCSMSASTWSSPNGATIHISAVPEAYTDGLIAAFEVRLGEEDAAVIPCEWNGTAFTASAELNAADGYSYYVVLTAPDGTAEEIAVNTPEQPVAEAFVNMETALTSYCSITVEESVFADGVLTLSGGTVKIQVPTITDDGAVITCREAELVLSLGGDTVARKALEIPAAGKNGAFEFPVSGVAFPVPEMEDDQRLDLTLQVRLSNDQELSAFGGNWFFNAEELLPVVG